MLPLFFCLFPSSGSGVGFMLLTASVILIMYFHTNSGTAIGIKLSGSAFSALAFPYLLLYLKEEYGIKGTFLILGGVLLHLTALSLLLREPIWVRSGINPSKSQNTPSVNCAATDVSTSRQANAGATALSQSSIVDTLMEGVRLFRSPIFYPLIIVFVIIELSKGTMSSTIVDYGQDKGFSLSDSESLVMYTAPTEIIGYVLLPMLADRKFLDRTTLTVASFIVLGVLICLVPECESYGSFTVVYMFIKLFHGSATTMRIVLLVDFFGNEKLPTCWGIGGLLSVPLFLLNPTIIGA